MLALASAALLGHVCLALSSSIPLAHTRSQCIVASLRTVIPASTILGELCDTADAKSKEVVIQKAVGAARASDIPPSDVGQVISTGQISSLAVCLWPYGILC